MSGEREARRWLEVAEEDLAFARYAEDGKYHAQACFASQQAAEKAVKAIHYARGARAVLGHSVRNLIERLDPRSPELDARLDDARDLDLYYVPTRYPNGLDAWTPATGFGRPQAERALAAAEAIFEAARGHLAAADGSA
ncbi:HEPN domain-containing protein [Candidatus Palauibacter sp.]|uniref:HEPN domain-containing protein n=1 Tax=Candidatus Palauibacter sp. TaxID=3101350 RepID=UPI003B0181CF